jgi:hypothetical protein
MKKAAHLGGDFTRILNRPRGQKDAAMQDAITESLTFPTGAIASNPAGIPGGSGGPASIAPLPALALGLTGPAADPLSQVLRQGARELLVAAVEAEAAQWIADHATGLNADGKRQVVRSGHAAARTILTGVGPLKVQMPRVHDRRPPEANERFASALLPPGVATAAGESLPHVPGKPAHRQPRWPRGSGQGVLLGTAGVLGPHGVGAVGCTDRGVRSANPTSRGRKDRPHQAI